MPVSARSTTKRAVIGVRMEALKRQATPVMSLDTVAASLAVSLSLPITSRHR